MSSEAFTNLVRERQRLCEDFDDALNRVVKAKEEAAEAKEVIAEFDKEHPYVMLVLKAEEARAKRAAKGEVVGVDVEATTATPDAEVNGDAA